MYVHRCDTLIWESVGLKSHMDVRNVSNIKPKNEPYAAIFDLEWLNDFSNGVFCAVKECVPEYFYWKNSTNQRHFNQNLFDLLTINSTFANSNNQNCGKMATQFHQIANLLEKVSVGDVNR